MTFSAGIRFRWISLGLGLAGAAAHAATFYSDPAAGRDTNDGASPSSAWQRCPGMKGWTGTAVLRPGDTLYFKRGATWTMPANSSGPGLDLKAGVHYIGDSWGTGGRAKLQASGRHEAGNVRFWEDHATILTEFEGFEVDGNGYRANAIDINHAFWTRGLTDAVKRIKGCVVHGQTGNGAEGDYKYGIIVSDNSPDASGAVANVEILDTVVYSVPRVGISIYPGDNGMLSNIVVRGCEVYQPCADPSYTRCHGIGYKGNIKNSVIEYSYVHNVGGAAVFVSGPERGTGVGPSGFVVRYNVLQTTAEEGVVRFYQAGSKSADIYGNILLPNEISGGVSFSGSSGTVAARIFNNTFFNCFVDIGNPSSTGTIEFRNNVVYELDDAPLTDLGQDITAHSNNLYYRVGGGSLVRSGGTTYTASTLSSYEATASSADPQFKSTSASLPNGFIGTYGVDRRPNSDGLSLLPGSYGIDHGAVLNAAFGGSINSVVRPAGSGWDLGAYEFSGGSQKPAPPTNLRVVP